jgi:hypothetical protein
MSAEEEARKEVIEKLEDILDLSQEIHGSIHLACNDKEVPEKYKAAVSELADVERKLKNKVDN